MTDLIPPQSPDHWLSAAFSSTTATSGGVIKRRLSDIDRIVGRDRFLDEVRERGFQAIENADTLIVFCNHAPVRLASARAVHA
jgi:hypothetical protein